MPPEPAPAESLRSEAARRIADISRGRVPAPGDDRSDWLHERQATGRRATRRVFIALAVAFVGLPATFGAMAIATGGFQHGPGGETALMVFIGGLAVGTPAAIAAAVIAFRNRSVLHPAVIAATAVPWLLVCTVAAWLLYEIN